MSSESTPSSRPGNALARQLFKFDRPVFIENLAQRPNGHILLTTFDQGRLYSLDPSSEHPEATVAAELPDVTNLTGIVEVEPDVFAVTGLVKDPRPFRFVPDSGKLFLVDFRGGDVPTVKMVTQIPGTETLNGMTALPDSPGVVMCVDSVEGRIFRVDTSTGNVDVPIKDDLMAIGTANIVPCGMNGIEVHDNHLYFTNSNQLLLGRIKIAPDGTPVGAAAEKVADASKAGFAYDDFTMAEDGIVYVTMHRSFLFRITPEGEQTMMVGVGHDVALNSPTSVIKTRDGKKLYVSTGGITAAGPGGGQVVEVQL